MRGSRHLYSILVVALALGALLAVAAPAAAAPGDRLWVRAYADGPYVEEFRDLAPGPLRSVYAVGVAKATEETGKLLVARYSPDGVKLWARVYGAGGAGASGYRALAVTGGVIVVGTVGNISSPHRGDILIVKYSAKGERLWTTRYDGSAHRNDWPAAIAPGHPGTVYVGGTSVGKGTGRDYVVLQVNAAGGQIVWTRRYDGPATSDDLRALHADVDGNVYVTGVSEDSGGSTAAATLMYDIAGKRLWLRRLHAGAGPTYGAGITISVDDAAVFVAGTTVGGMSTGEEVMLAKLAIDDGAKQWTQTAGVTDGNERALAFAASGTHGFAIAGETEDRGSGDIQGFVATWDQFGTFEWQKTFTMGLSTDDALFTCVSWNSAGGVYCGGLSAAAGTAEDFTVVRYADDGGISWSNAYDGAAHETDLCRDILVRGTGVYAGGFVGKGGMNTSALLIKYAR